MKTYSYGRSRLKGTVMGLVSLLMVVAGVALIGSFFLAGGLNPLSSAGTGGGGFNVPTLDKGDQNTTSGPEDKTLRLTIPSMARIDDAEVPMAPGTDTDALDSNKAIHLQGSGYPWEDGSNVYIAGHRLGYPATGSFLSFYDLNDLKDGDEVFVTDADGEKYTYKVFREMTVSPSNLSVTKPVSGKSVITLQTCTLPDYSQRLIVQAELVKKA